MFGVLFPLAALAGAGSEPRESFKQVIDKIDGTVGHFNAQLEALAPSPASPSSLLERAPTSDEVKKAVEDEWNKIKVVNPTSWVGAAGFPKDPDQRGFYTNLDKELAIFKQMKTMWKQKSEDYDDDIKKFAKETSTAETERKQVEQHLREHPFYVKPGSFLELGATASGEDKPADLTTVEKRLAALRDKMEGDANRINREAALLDSPSLVQREDDSAAPATSFLEEDPPALNPEHPTLSPGEKARNELLKEKMAAVTVATPGNWVEAAGFPHNPHQRAVYQNLDQEMDIYKKMKMKWRRNLKRVFAEIHSYKHDAEKDLAKYPKSLTGEVPTSLLQIGASDAAERYEKAQRLLSSMSSFLQEHGIDELDGEENDFQDELNREDLKRTKRKEEDITEGKKFTRKDEEGWLEKMKATQAVLQEQAKKYQQQGAVAEYMSGAKKPAAASGGPAAPGAASSLLEQRAQAAAKDGHAAVAHRHFDVSDAYHRHHLHSFQEEEKATDSALKNIEQKFLNQASYLKQDSMKLLEDPTSIAPLSLLQRASGEEAGPAPDAGAGHGLADPSGLDDSAMSDAADTLPGADGLKKAEADSEALVAKIKKSNDAFKRSETDDEIARQVDSPSSFLQIVDFGDDPDPLTQDTLNDKFDSLNSDLSPSEIGGDLSSSTHVGGVPLFDDVKLGTQFGSLDDDPYKIPTESFDTTPDPSNSLDSFNSLGDDSPTSFTSPTDTLDPALSDDAGLGSTGFQPGSLVGTGDDSSSMPSFDASSDATDVGSSDDFKSESFLKTDSDPYIPSFSGSSLSYPDVPSYESSSMDPVSWIETKSNTTVGSNRTAEEHNEINLRKVAGH